MEWVKRKGTTGKVEPSEKFLEEEKFTFQRAISRVVLHHDIPPDFVLTLDQTPLSYVSPGKYTFWLKGSTTVPIKGVDDKRQITATPFPRIVVHAPLSEKTRFFDIFVGGIVPPLTGACTSISGYTCMHQYAKRVNQLIDFRLTILNSC